MPETIASLREAGMKVWVLTGDKQETAISIAYSAQLITESQKVLILSAPSVVRLVKVFINFLAFSNRSPISFVFI